MNRAVRRGVVLAAGAAVVAWGGGQLTGSPVALADATTSAVTAGPSTFTQAQASGGPSQYDTPLERCSHGVDYPITGTNPILSEPVTTSAQSNVPISITARYEGNEWYGVRYLDITNTGTQAFNLQCAVTTVSTCSAGIPLAPSIRTRSFTRNGNPFAQSLGGMPISPPAQIAPKISGSIEFVNSAVGVDPRSSAGGESPTGRLSFTRAAASNAVKVASSSGAPLNAQGYPSPAGPVNGHQLQE